MADELLRSQHVFGKVANLISAIDSGKVNEFDILFLHDENDKPIIGWVDKQGNPIFIENKNQVIPVDSLPEAGEDGVIYIFDNKGYYWNGTEFVDFCKPTDVSELESELVAKIDQALLDAKAYTDEEIEGAVNTAKAYTDEQINTILNMFTIVEI